uniref:Uncharacterized protein n=1 Tax=Lactuca sativa TaxID=4236 RepID=A0A9R1VKP4_LACSA|nr:hypothetical protein LSAT_V11C500241650 [Lactuca sativa]
MDKYDSYTYLNLDEFEALLTLDELIGAVIWSYVNMLFNKIKYGPPERDHGICFVNPIVILLSNHKGKSKNIDDASRSVADHLSTRNDNDIILLSYNLDEMVLHATQSGPNKKYPVQLVSTKCGYYMLKFMKEIVEEENEVLVNDNVSISFYFHYFNLIKIELKK